MEEKRSVGRPGKELCLIETAQQLDEENKALMDEVVYLTPEEEAFCHAFLTSKSPAQAVRKAKILSDSASISDIYTKARIIWSKPEVKIRVRQLQLPLLYEHLLVCESAFQELTKIAFSDITEFVDFIEDDAGVVTAKVNPKNLKKMNELGLTSVIQQVKIFRGGAIQIKTADKLGALNKILDVLVGQRKSIQISGNVKHDHQVSLVDLLNKSGTPESQEFIKEIYPSKYAKNILTENQGFAQPSKLMKKEEKKKKKVKKTRRKEMIFRKMKEIHKRKEK